MRSQSATRGSGRNLTTPRIIYTQSYFFTFQTLVFVNASLAMLLHLHRSRKIHISSLPSPSNPGLSPCSFPPPAQWETEGRVYTNTRFTAPFNSRANSTRSVQPRPQPSAYERMRASTCVSLNFELCISGYMRRLLCIVAAKLIYCEICCSA